MDEMITLPYGKGTVTVPKGSRIKVYSFIDHILNYIKGFLLDYDKIGLTLLICDPESGNFDKKIMEGKQLKISNDMIIYFRFYPEVTILETKKENEK